MSVFAPANAEKLDRREPPVRHRGRNGAAAMGEGAEALPLEERARGLRQALRPP